MKIMDFLSDNSSIVPATLTPSAAGTFKEIYGKLLPVLLQCFVVVGFGYISGKTRLITSSDTKGLHLLTSYFLLPCLIFKSLATIDLYSVNYKFLLSIFIGKFIIFTSVAILTWLLKRKNRCSFAGLFAIFCSQSNDFALGYPLVTFLYGKDHPEFSHYLYLIAPIQLMLLNPIGFIMMEYGRIASDTRPSQCRQSFRSRFKQVFYGIIRNPIICMTGAGIVANFAFSAKLPFILETVMEPLSSAFSGCALFLLGQNMISGLEKMSKYSLLTTTLIVTVKILAAPLVIREVISHMHIQDDAYTDFGFLYGMLPPAPTVAIFATQFCLPGDAVSAGVVAGTFLAAPLIFISATMSQIKTDPSYRIALTKAIAWSGALAAPLCIFTMVVLYPKRKRITHSTTLWLLFAQLIAATGGSMLFWVTEEDHILNYIQTTISLGGVFASRIWTAMIAVILMLANQRSLCFVLKIRSTLIVAGFAASLIATIILMASIPFGSDVPIHKDPNFHLGRVQAGVACVFLIASLILTIYGLVHQQRFQSREEYEPILPAASEDESRNLMDNETPSQPNPSRPSINTNTSVVVATTSSCANCSCSNTKKEPGNNDIEDVEDIGKPKFVKRRVPRVRKLSERKDNPTGEAGSSNPLYCGPSYHCSPVERKACVTAVKSYLDVVHQAEEATELETDLHQIFRHVVLLIMLSFSMLVGLAVSLWQLFTEAPTGILLELEFLDIVLNYGQGILTFIVFGADGSVILMPFRFVYRLFNRNKVQLRAYCEISDEVKHTCEAFRMYHMQLCASDICPGVELEQVQFSGQQLCDWLVAIGLARNRDDALEYGRNLLEGRTIAHVANAFHFEDDVHLYEFINYPPCALMARTDNNIV